MIFLSEFFYKVKVFFVLILTFLFFSIIRGQNPIVEENQHNGNPSSEWDVSGAGDLSIQGFATDISVNKGDNVHFKIDVALPATSFSLKIYRLGYYQGNGARLIADLGNFTGTPQPFVFQDSVTGLTDCSGWSESASWEVPINAVSGIYIVKLTRADNNGSSHMVFIVRDDYGNSPILFKTSDATWQAYNHYRYFSLYIGQTTKYSHAVKVSYNRPFYTRDGLGGGNGTKDWLFNAEYPMIRWMERNGYNVSYTTDLDMDRDSVRITPTMHKIMMSVGHDEYWSAAERSKFENARDAGVHLAFFSGDEVYWKTRWENNHHTLVCYKEGTLGEYNCGGKCDPEVNIWTGLWRDGCSPGYLPNDGCLPETSLSGQISWSNSRGAIEVPAKYKDLGFWRHTSIASSTSGQTTILPFGTLGDEWDAYQDQFESTYPKHRILLSSTFLNGQTHNLSLYRHNSGALVFGAGTIQWAWGLDENHDNGSSPTSSDMQQATVNLFADMGVIPSTLQSDLIASASGDNLPPSTVISFPSNGTMIQGSLITITGSATDAGGGKVAGVELSFNGGSTWQAAEGTENWIFYWQPTSSGLNSIMARAWDDLGNLEIPGTVGSGNNKEVTVTEICYSIFQSITPSISIVNNVGNGNAPLEVGVKFFSNFDGYISGLRFYKGIGGQGIHIGNLWSINGDNLASVTFNNETASGWQTVTLNTPVAITANTIYVVSYFSQHGDFVKTDPYFISDKVNGPLTGLGWTATEPNGIYKYSSSSAFPNVSTYAGSSNYWADVIFTITPPTDLTPPNITSVLPVSNAISVPISYHLTAIFNEALDSLSANSSTFTLAGPGGTNVSGIVKYSNSTATFIPLEPLAVSTTYVATLKGGVSGSRIKDHAGNALVEDFSWQFTTEGLSIPSITEHPVSQNVCVGKSVRLYSSAIGTPSPTLQWQVSTNNGIVWVNIPGAISSPYIYLITEDDDAKQFRAVWTNQEGSINSTPATLTIISSLFATISSSGSACHDSPFQLQLSDANGFSPYSLIVNGRSFDEIIPGQSFISISTTDESLWSDSDIPSILAQNDGNSIELGVKFIAAMDGYIKGIRFYKGLGNTGSHSGSLWTTDGILLTTALFSSETSTGWQEVLFSSPIAISANTTYIASYHTNVGYYSKSTNYFSVTHSNGSLMEALSANVVGGNGVYKYGGGFPNTISADNTNYWVDVIFSYSNSNTAFSNKLTKIIDKNGCTSSGNPLSTTVFNVNANFTTPPIVNSPVNYCQYSSISPVNVSGSNLLWYSSIVGGIGSTIAPLPSTEIIGTTSYFVSQTISGCESSKEQIDIIVHGSLSKPIFELTQPDCNSDSGAIFITDPIGTGIVYSIDGINYQSSTSFIPIAEGNYALTAKNNEGCISAEAKFTINKQPTTPDSPFAEIVQPSCVKSTGIIKVTSSNSGLFFSINGSDYTNEDGVFTNVPPGLYNLTAKNSSGCISLPTSLILNQVPIAPLAPAVIVSQPTCIQGLGTIKVTSLSAGLLFSLDGVNFNDSTGLFSGLYPGIYNLFVKDTSNNCLSPPTSITVFDQPETPSPPLASVIQPSCNVATGTITIISPVAGLSFSIDELNYSNNNGIFTGVDPGNYNLTAKNNDGCLSDFTKLSIFEAPPIPTATISTMGSSTCPGSPFQLKLLSATGISQSSLYDLKINGYIYNGISIGQTFATIQTVDESLWPGTITPDIQSVSDQHEIELGVKFLAKANGYIKGIRFYKGYGNSGIHTGSLWTIDGILLANATFKDETFLGWQEVHFDNPVEIEANTIYIASYYTPTGRFSEDQGYFSTNTYSNGSMLQAIASIGSNGNGVFNYAGGFPDNNSPNRSNYWVDVLYSYSSNDTAFFNNLTAISEQGGCENTGTNPSLDKVTFNLNSTSTIPPIVNSHVSYCEFDPAIPLSAMGSNLVWFTSDTSETGSDIAPTPSTFTTGAVSYYVSQSLEGCESERSQINVVVNHILSPSVSVVADKNNICAGIPVTFTPIPVGGGLTPVYQWFKNTVAVATGTTYMYIPENGDEIYALMTSSEVCSTGNPVKSNTVNLVINPVVLPSVSAEVSQNNVCSGTQVTFTATPIEGGATPTYEWFNNLVSVATGSTYTCIPENGDQVYALMIPSEVCSIGLPIKSNTIAVVTNPVTVSNVSIDVSQNNVCSGTSVTFTATPIVGETTPTYEWFKNMVSVATGSTFTCIPENGDLVYTVMTSGLTCTANNPVSSITTKITVVPLPGEAGIVDGQSTFCQGSIGAQYSVAPIAQADNYIWNIPQGATIVEGSGTNVITVDFGKLAENGNISVYGANGCGSGKVSPDFTVTSSSIPSSPTITLDNYTLTSNALIGNQWYYNDSLIPGGTNESYNITQSGTYYSIVTLNSCSSDTSNKIIVLWTRIMDVQTGNFELYPVPCNGLFTASMTYPKTETFAIRVYNNLGVLVFNENDIKVDGTTKYLIDLSTEPSGMYFVTFTTGIIQVNRKIVINNNVKIDNY